MPSSPEISVLMSVYNGERFLREAIDSVLNQSFRNFEFIIINDGSNDNSQNIINEYAKMDDRIRVHNQENEGLIASLNKGLEIAKSNLIARMDADDVCALDRFEKQFSYMSLHKNVGVLGGAITLIDDHGHIIRKSSYPFMGKDMDDFILRGSPVAHPAVMMRKDLVLGLGGYRKAYKSAEDYDLWLRLKEKTNIDNLSDVLLFYRQHDDKISFKFAHQQALASVIARLAFRQRCLGKPDPTECLNSLSPSSINLFELSEDERQSIELEILEITSNSLSLVKGIPALNDAFQDVLKLSKGNKEIRARIFLRLARGYVCYHYWNKAVYCSFMAFLTSPRAFLSMVWGIIRSYILFKK